MFELNKELHQADLPKMRQKIDWALQQGARSVREFTTGLQKEGIELMGISVGRGKKTPTGKEDTGTGRRRCFDERGKKHRRPECWEKKVIAEPGSPTLPGERLSSRLIASN
jgi:hypothetical protein